MAFARASHLFALEQLATCEACLLAPIRGTLESSMHNQVASGFRWHRF